MAKTAPRPEPAENREHASEYDEFEKLARKLVNVPKKEIDAERKKANGDKPAR